MAVSDRFTVGQLKILAAGGSFPLGSLTGFHAESFPCTDSTVLQNRIEAVRPDVLLIDCALATPGLADMLAHSVYAGMPVILRVGDTEADAEAAGLLFGCPLQFLPPETDHMAVLAAVHQATESLQHHAADSGARFDGADRIAALKRDAERITAAIAELAAARPDGAARPVDAPRIRAHIRARRLRERFFPADLFADPAWDMLLDLSAARLEDRPVSVSSLCIAASVPTTTALRWVKNLCDSGILVRASDPGDARRAFISMSDATARAMDACLDAVLNQPGQ